MPKGDDQRQSADARLGQTVDEYTLLSVLGTGSTSTVYLAQRLGDPRALVAVKILSYHAAPQASDRVSFRKRFLREARAVGKLRNEHILPVLSYGDSDDLTYMVMPVIVGGTLSVRMGQEDGPLPLPEVVGYLDQLADALDYAHQQGLVHRDVKPSNILLDEHGHLYLTDFGIARLFENPESTLTHSGALTGTGQILGTPYYMAPEQITGDPVTPQTDVYATGVLLYQLVTGQVPFPGDTPLAVALQHLQEAPPSPRLLREELGTLVADVIMRGMAKDPEDRYPSVGELAAAFSEALTSTATLAGPLPAGTSSGAWPFATSYGTQMAFTGDSEPDDLDPQLADVFDEMIGTRIGEYRVEHLRDANERGARFVVRREAGSAPSLLRLLVPPSDLEGEEQEAFRAEAEERCAALVTLDHPAIEHVVDSGIHLGMPYVITEAVSGKPLAETLAARGAMDPAAIGRSLAVLADALEYAHASGVLHLNLSAESIVTRGERDLTLTDFALSTQTLGSGAVAPEQLLGEPATTATDVYALGSVLYLMLTAHRVFEGETSDEIIDQHLNATIPPARTWRSGLPSGIESVLARAMAKEPEYRYATPRELATAYQKVIARANAAPSASAALSRTGTSAAATNATRAAVLSNPQMRSSGPVRTTTASAPVRSSAQDSVATRLARVPGQSSVRNRQVRTPSDSLAGSTSSGLTRRRVETQIASLSTPTSASLAASISGGSNSSQLRSSIIGRLPALPAIQNRMNGRLRTEIISVIVVLCVVAASFILFNAFRPGAKASVAPPAGGPGGAVHFFDGPNGTSTNALSMEITDLAAPPSGSTYHAWLVDDKGEHFLSLGALTAAKNGWALDFDSAKSASNGGTNLLGFGDKVEITLEQGDVPTPVGNVALTGTFPPVSFSHIRHLMVSFPATPGEQGLLVGTRSQGTDLNQQAQVLLSFFQREYYVSANCAAQSIVDILEGSNGTHYQPLNSDCEARNITQAGDGYGLLGENGYLAGVNDHASLAAHSDDASPDIRQHSAHVTIAMTNVEGWMKTIEQDALDVLAGNHNLAKAQEIATLADKALHGVDINGNETIDPIAGEAGIATAYSHGQLLAQLELSTPKTK